MKTSETNHAIKIIYTRTKSINMKLFVSLVFINCLLQLKFSSNKCDILKILENVYCQ